MSVLEPLLISEPKKVTIFGFYQQTCLCPRISQSKPTQKTEKRYPPPLRSIKTKRIHPKNALSIPSIYSAYFSSPWLSARKSSPSRSTADGYLSTGKFRRFSRFLQNHRLIEIHLGLEYGFPFEWPLDFRG